MQSIYTFFKFILLISIIYIKHTLTQPSTTSIPNACDCFDIDIVCSPIQQQDEICYYYKLNRISNESHCSGSINYLLLGTGNLDDCGLSLVDIDEYLFDYAPKQYDITTESNGVYIDGIKLILPDTECSCSITSSSDSDINLSVKLAKDSACTDDSEPVTTPIDDFIIFSVCFDSSVVGGTQENGQIELSFNNEAFTCDVPDILPDFCNFATTSSPAPVTTSTTMISTTPAPPICNTTDAFNIAFLLDESGSISSEEWEIAINFIDRLIQYHLSPPSYVSLWEYASLHAFKQFLDWTPIGYDRSIFTNALNNNKYNKAGLTFTWDAVNRVLDAFWDYRFTCTDGCDTRKDILFLLTDGAPTDIVCPDMIERVNQSDVDIVIIGVGVNATNWMQEIECLDHKDDYNDIFIASEFSHEELYMIEELLRENHTCSDCCPSGPSVRPEEGSQWDYGNGTYGLGPVPTSPGNGGQQGAGDATSAP